MKDLYLLNNKSTAKKEPFHEKSENKNTSKTKERYTPIY